MDFRTLCSKSNHSQSYRVTRVSRSLMCCSEPRNVRSEQKFVNDLEWSMIQIGLADALPSCSEMLGFKQLRTPAIATPARPLCTWDERQFFAPPVGAMVHAAPGSKVSKGLHTPLAAVCSNDRFGDLHREARLAGRGRLRLESCSPVPHRVGHFLRMTSLSGCVEDVRLRKIAADGMPRSRGSLPVQAQRDPAWRHPLDLRWAAAESAAPTAHRCS